MKPGGVYVSIPFCAQKCTYCHFRSGVFSGGLRAAYVRHLASELSEGLPANCDTLYFGGGSPSLLDPAEFGHLAASLPRLQWSEATIEVAPGEARPDRVVAWAAAGVSRASMGVQSFSAEVARAAGRRHDAATVRSDVARLAGAGIRNVSVDLLAGLARQSAATWSESLDWVERLGVSHVSVYMLESDDDSRLGRELRAGGARYGAKTVPSEQEILDLYLQAVERLGRAGYERYEISNFARPGGRSLHNLKYWTMRPYFGFGSDAHSFDGHRRWSNVADAPGYVRLMAAGRSPRAAAERIGSRRALEDRVLTGIRTSDGVRLEPSELAALETGVDELAARGWLAAVAPSLRLTSSGLLFADEAAAVLLAGSGSAPRAGG